MHARLVLGYYSSWFEILDYRLNDKTGMITLLLPDETIIVHKTNVIISVKTEANKCTTL